MLDNTPRYWHSNIEIRHFIESAFFESIQEGNSNHRRLEDILANVRNSVIKRLREEQPSRISTERYFNRRVWGS